MDAIRRDDINEGKLDAARAALTANREALFRYDPMDRAMGMAVLDGRMPSDITVAELRALWAELERA